MIAIKTLGVNAEPQMGYVWKSNGVLPMKLKLLLLTLRAFSFGLEALSSFLT
jgi:hypothetical protein